MKITKRWGWTVALGTAATLCATGVWAEQEIARLKDVTGNVLVSGQMGLATGKEAQRLARGVRVITTANSRVLVVFDNGCDVRLEENQRFDVEDRPCAALLPQALGAAPASSQGLAGIIVPALVGGGAAVAIINATPVSPN